MFGAPQAKNLLVENIVFTESAQKWSSFRKKILQFFPLLGGGGLDPTVENKTFFNPSLNSRVYMELLNF